MNINDRQVIKPLQTVMLVGIVSCLLNCANDCHLVKLAFQILKGR